MVDRRTFLSGVAGLGAVTLIGCSEDEPARPGLSPSPSPTPSPSRTSEDVNPRVTGTVARDLNVPWGIAFLSTGDALVAQRDAGSIVRVTRVAGCASWATSAVRSAPGERAACWDSRSIPTTKASLFAFVTTSAGRPRRPHRARRRPARRRSARSSPASRRAASTTAAGCCSIARATSSSPPARRATRPSRRRRDRSAARSSASTATATPSTGNPFGNRTWSYGHRNIEGLAFDDEGRLWASEFGANRFDELNLVEKGQNYGWPRFEGKSDDNDYVTPKVTWTTDECSPSGLAIHRSTAFVAALRGECLWAVPLDGTDTGKPRAYFQGEYGRIRTVVVAPDESLWMTTSNTDGRGDPGKNDDRILRVTL